ncbi:MULTISPECIES: hydrolase [Lacticaseibacillus]|uniref:Hydrolase n=3 Tax=Lacticaseibacillus TaxID=2759736 RepID=A0AAN1C716_LACCA|nr:MULTISPECIES: hydrolase [Lacticaseibacillus]ARY90453.1 hydrolase [Lacticaseibacillus casei]KAB1969800.1 hydrolase [Lacticaseibacillus casei]KLI75211.1 hydrolase [Lacticaseibacillus casei]MDE3281377.1 hydrolase [Lacticaseibacillus casei]WLV78298.1 hydrolase [Lacticaseibacillus sp. NCIMB 15471]
MASNHSQKVEAIADHATSDSDNSKVSAKSIVLSNEAKVEQANAYSLVNPKNENTITVGTNDIAEAAHQIADQKAAAAKAAEEQAAAEKAAAEKAAADQAAAEKAAQEQQAQAQAAQNAANAAAASAAPTSTAQTTQTTTNKGTFKLSFYDPAVLGSNMGYDGVAANLSVFPKGTRLKITLSDGTVWYRTVNDTGSFAAGNPNQLDVAMPNSQIPSAGVMSATVEVVG